MRGGELEEVDVLALGRHLLDRLEEPLRQAPEPELLGRLGRHPRRRDVPGIVGEGVLAELQRLVMLPLRPRRLGPHQDRLVLGPDQHPDLRRVVVELLPLGRPATPGGTSGYRARSCRPACTCRSRSRGSTSARRHCRTGRTSWPFADRAIPTPKTSAALLPKAKRGRTDFPKNSWPGGRSPRIRARQSHAPIPGVPGRARHDRLGGRARRPTCPRRGPTLSDHSKPSAVPATTDHRRNGEAIPARRDGRSGHMATILRDAGLSELVEGQEVERLARGFEFTEGPLWCPDGSLLFQDIKAERTYRLDAGPLGPSAARPDRGGQRPDLRPGRPDRLLRAERPARLADESRRHRRRDAGRRPGPGKRLNSPNDIVCRSDGLVYFTDPPYGVEPAERALHFQGVFSLDLRPGAAGPGGSSRSSCSTTSRSPTGWRSRPTSEPSTSATRPATTSGRSTSSRRARSGSARAGSSPGSTRGRRAAPTG